MYHKKKTLSKNIPIHVGTAEQTDTRVDTLWDTARIFYTHKLVITLTNPYPEILWDIDKGVGHTTSDFTKYGNYNEFVYHNSVEGYPAQKDNLSIFIVNLGKALQSSEINDVTYTR